MRASVLIPLPLDGPYDYLVPGDLTLERGDFVAVPLGPREVRGVVWAVHEGDGAPDGVDPAKLKQIFARLDAPPLSEALLKFVDWVADYTLTPPGSVLRLVMRSAQALEGRRMVKAYVIGGPEPERMTGARSRVLSVLGDGLPRTPAELAGEAGVSSGVAKGLAAAGTLSTVDRPADLPFDEADPDHEPVALSPAQKDAADELVRSVQERKFSATLLDGVTGSGKTETYFEAIAEALRQGTQALVLLPEIALTIQFLERFEKRFGAMPGQWHSDLSSAERRRTWRAVAEGKVQVLVGARSALFLPFPDLGLIIVDEEHESAFKQEDGVIYHARDMAVVRASLSDIAIVLSSATPSLETLGNAQQGRYRRLILPDRHGGAVLPDIEAIDMRIDKPDSGHWLSPVLVEALRETFEAGEQAMLYLNRRGYAPLTLCRNCGHRIRSPHASSWMVEHRFSNRLVCHQTGFSMPKPKACPECGAVDALVGCGPGVERIFEEAQKLFPDLQMAIMSSDTVSKPSEAQEMINWMVQGEIDLLIGTQMVAKGHHFPGLTLVGVVDADLGLAGGDLRAAERTFQLLYQVAGRAGRVQKKGRVLLQSYMPEHEVMQALISGDRDAFLDAEAQARNDWGLPPFGRLASLIISGPNEALVIQTGRALARAAPAVQNVEVMGPAPAPFAMIRGRYRQRMLVKTARDIDLQSYLGAWLPQVKTPGTVRVTVDIDPYSFS